MLKINDNEITGIYSGSNSISKIYEGQDVIWEKSTGVVFPAEDSLLHYWKLDEDSGTVLEDGVGNYDLDASNTAIVGGNGKNNNALDFTQGDYYAHTDRSFINLNKSISMWVKPSSIHNAFLFNGYIDGSTSNFTVIWYADSTTHNGFSVNIGDNWAGSFSVASLDEWHLVVGTNDGTETKLYVDGDLINTSQDADNEQTIDEIYIGSNTSTGGFFDGYIDEVAVFDKTLTQEEVTELWNNGYGVYYDSPVVDVSGVNFTSEDPFEVAEGSTKQLEWQVEPQNATYNDVTFSSSDTNIATVDSDGVVTGVDSGNVTITVTTNDGGYTDTISGYIVESAFPTEDLVYYYGFNENSDTNVYNSVTDSVDCELTSSNLRTSDGKNNDALDFNNTTEYAYITDRDIGNIFNEHSVNFWFKGNSSSNNEIFFGEFNDVDNQAYRIGKYDDNSLVFFIRPSNYVNVNDMYWVEVPASTFTNYLDDDTWHMITYVHSPDGANDCRVYIDGDEMSVTVSRDGNKNDFQTLEFDLYVGAENLRGVRQSEWNGSMDEIAFWNRQLTSTEVDILWNDGDGVYYDTPQVDTTGVNFTTTEPFEVYEGSTKQLEWEIEPSNATNKDVTFSSSDTDIATVDSNGIVSGVDLGSVTITVTTDDGGYTDTIDGDVIESQLPEINSLVHYYGFDESSGTLTKNYVTDNDATANDSRVLGNSGFHENCADFTQGDDYILSSDLKNLGTLMANPMTVSFWINLTDDDFRLLSSFYGTYLGFHIYISGEKPRFYFRDDNGNLWAGYADFNLNLNQWHHVVYSFDTNQNLMNIYVDSDEKTNVIDYNDQLTDFSDFGNDIPIGCRDVRGSYDLFSDAEVDELAIWDTMLTEDEVDILWNNGNGIFY